MTSRIVGLDVATLAARDRVGSMGAAQIMIAAARPGRIANQRTMRYVPSHLPQTIARVEIGVAISTSRLPRTRSSPREVGAWPLSSSMPRNDCTTIDMISTKPPLGVSSPYAIALATPIPTAAIAPNQ